MRLKTYKMAMSIFPEFLTLKWNISRTIWRIEVGDGSFFAFFTSFHLSLTFFRPEVPFISQRSYGFLITKELIFGFQILDLKDHFSASLKEMLSVANCHNCAQFDSKSGIRLCLVIHLSKKQLK